MNQIVNHRGRENAPQHQDPSEPGMNMSRPGPNAMVRLFAPKNELNCFCMIV